VTLLVPLVAVVAVCALGSIAAFLLSLRDVGRDIDDD
jgi:hypothetical protein